jgi:RNA polymerase sigma-70 factor (ECF subfamily)
MDDLASLSDAALLRAAAENPEAFGEFYDRHARAVLGFLFRRTDSPDTAADLCAETFAAAFVQRRRFRDTGAPARAWLYAIARNLLSHYVRRQRVSDRYRRRIGAPVLSMDDEQLERVEELADVAQYRLALREAIQELPEKLADAVVLRIGHDLPYVDVAARLGCSEGAARVRVSRGLTRLVDRLEEP